MTLLNVLAPEILTFEELRALWHFAAELRFVFLLEVLVQLILKSLVDRFAANLPKIYVLRFQNLQQFVFVGSHPVEGALQLLLGLRAALELLLLLNRRGSWIILLLGLLFLEREGLVGSARPSSNLGSGGKAGTWSTKMTAWALACKLMHRVAFKDAEEAEVVDAS